MEPNELEDEEGPEEGDEAPDPREAAVMAVVAEAEALGAEERWDEARSMLLEAVEEHGEHAHLFCWLGIASERLGEEGEAYEFFRRALAQEPTDPFVLAAAGTGVAAYDDPEAERALRLAALTAPDFPFARAAYGTYLAREGMYDQAIAELVAARDMAPDDTTVRAELGVSYLLARRTEEGLAELENALGGADEGWMRGLFGLALLDAGRGEEGAEQLHRAATERVEDVEIQLLAALAAASEGWEDEAWAALARAEDAALPEDRELIREVEEAVEDGPEAAEGFLREYLGPTLLRERLHQRA